MRLAGRVAVVTGAASGIGRGVIELFAREGSSVAAVDSDRDAVEEAVAAIAESGGVARAYAVDVSDPASAKSTIESVLDAWNRIDVLVTSAAVSYGGTATETEEADWDRVFAVNVKGTYLWVREVLPTMVAAKRGSIITVASQLAFAGGRGNASYVASKGAVIALTRAVALDYATDGVRANTLVPGAVETPMLRRSFARQPDPGDAEERSRARHPLGRFGSVGELAHAALYLASDESAFTTGSELVIDGGWRVG